MNKLTTTILDDAKTIIPYINPTKFAGKTVLITGASGLLGTYMLASLKIMARKTRRPFKVIAVGHGKLLPYQKNLLDYKDAKLIRGDLSDQNFIQKLPKADYIVHAAGYGQPGKFMENPIKTLKINTDATFSLIEKLKPGGKFLFMSSSEIYSGAPKPPYKESTIGTTSPSHPRACYIEGKRCGEAIVNAYREMGIEAKSARLSLIYGPGTKQGDARVLNSFIEKAIAGRIDLLDEGASRRTYCYVTDAVTILWNILLNGKESVYNVGGKSRITIRELAKKIGGYIGAPIKIPRLSSDDRKTTGAPIDVQLNMEKVEKEFSKRKYIDLDEGLKRTIEWQKILYNN